jgi:peptidoglycan/LPS O-acetylase OafA/YrhL
LTAIAQEAVSPPLPQPEAIRVSRAASSYLDITRALAANLVMVSHIYGVLLGGEAGYVGGSLGVVIFFLLSGFLITQSMIGRARRGDASLPHFLADRIARIMTPYVPVLVIVAVVDVVAKFAAVNDDGLSAGPVAFLVNLFMLQDYPVFQALLIFHRSIPWRIRPYLSDEPLWTVAVEFWIYVAAGLSFYGFGAGLRIKRWIAICLALVSFPVVIWNASHGSGECLSLVWCIGALAGYASCSAINEASPRRSLALAATVGVVSGLALGLRVAHVGIHPYDFQSATLFGLLYFSTVYALNFLATRAPLVEAFCSFFASYSYSLYLIHNTVLWLARPHLPTHPGLIYLIETGVACHIVAIMIYLAFEQHHRQVGWILRPLLTRLMSAGQRRAPARIRTLS